MRIPRCCKLFVLILSLAAGLWAQTYQGTIVGTVKDQSGAVVPGATVTITDVGKGTSRHLQTNSVGDYTAPNLEPGLYNLTAEVKGFQRTVRSNIRLEVARSIRIDFDLVPGSEQQVVQVTDEAPIIDTTTATLEGTFTNNAIVSLPLQGRDWQNLVTLRPGIQRRPGGGFLSISSNGNRVEDNNYIVDGIDDNDAYYGDTVMNAAGVQGTPASHLPIDAIQEFNVQESPEADYGWKPGAIVQLGIKSGTNELHGTAYYFGRNSAIDARNYFNPRPETMSPLRMNQFGGSIGGPIIKDKLFFFANYEGTRDIVGNPVIKQTPLTVSAGGDPSISFPDAIAECTPNCNPLSMALIPLFPANDGSYNPSDPTGKPFDMSNTNREDSGIVKVDYHLNAKNVISGRYFIGDSFQIEEDYNVLNSIYLSQATTRPQVFGVSWAWTPTPTIVNQLRFGFNTFWQKIMSGDSQYPSTYFGITTGVTDPLNYGLPAINIGGFNALGGNSSWPLRTTPNTTWQITDSISQTKGKHNLKYGGEFRTGNTDNIRNRYGKGSVTFRTLPAFLDGTVRSSRTKLFLGDSHRVVSQKSFGFFVQDDWHVKPRLTLTMGLRYDVSLPIKEQSDLLGNFDPSVGLVQVGKQIDRPYGTDWNNVAPRLGFAWDMFGDGKTVLRAGAGIIYEIPHISLFIGQNNAEALGLATVPTGAINAPGNGTIDAGVAGPDVTWTDSSTPIFGDVSNMKIDCTTDSSGGCRVFGVDNNIRTPYVANWNLNIQHAFAANSVLQIAYVGNRGIKLYSIRDINQNVYANDVNGDEMSGRPFYSQFPTLSYIDMLQNKDDSIYNGLQVTFTQRPWHGLEFVGGYTYAKAIDVASGNRAYSWEDTNNPLLERGPADSDIRHRFTLAMTYSTPKLPHYDAAFGGWQVSNILTLQTAQPVDYYDAYNDFSWSGDYNDRWSVYGDPGNFKWSFKGLPYYPAYYDDNDALVGNPKCIAIATAQGSLDTLTADYGGCYVTPQGDVMLPPATGAFGNLRRNSMRGPAFTNWDISLAKTFKLTERVSLQLRGEMFNVLNHPNFSLGSDSRDVSNGPLGSVGIPIYTPDVYQSNPVMGSGGSRHIQYGAKVIF